MMPGRLVVLLLAATPAYGGSILDYIRNYDLNDYALGVAYSVSESPYLGDDSSGYAYPYLTSFRHSAFTDAWLIVTNGDVGVRWVNDSGWVLGAVTAGRRPSSSFRCRGSTHGAGSCLPCHWSAIVRITIGITMACPRPKRE